MLSLRWNSWNDFPVGLCGFLFRRHTPTRSIFTEGNIYRLYRLGVVDFFFFPSLPFRFR